MGVQVKAQGREPVLAVDDQEFLLRLGEVPDALDAWHRLEAQLLGREQQHRSGNRRLGDGHLVEVLELVHLGAGKRAL